MKSDVNTNVCIRQAASLEMQLFRRGKYIWVKVNKGALGDKGR